VKVHVVVIKITKIIMINDGGNRFLKKGESITSITIINYNNSNNKKEESITSIFRVLLRLYATIRQTRLAKKCLNISAAKHLLAL
jgi:hypothetical protein